MILDSDQEALTLDSEDPVEFIDETVRWRGRDTTYMAGQWDALSKRIPRFALEDFRAYPDGPANPHLRAVVRLPVTVTEQRMPVGAVSTTYRLVQHADVVEMCLRGVGAHHVDPSTLRCQVGLTPLGEWMNFRAFFPDGFSYTPRDGKKLALRMECFNSVDGSSRLVILFSWFRFFCSNGLIIGETKAALRDAHNEHLNLARIPEIISDGLARAHADVERLRQWETSSIETLKLDVWIDHHLAERWGKKAACRTLHICRSGHDVEMPYPFAGGKPSEKEIRLLTAVPGAAKPATNLYDVCQALSWIATHRSSADERLEWQEQIAGLIENLRCHLQAA